MHSQNTKARLYNKGLQHSGKYDESFCVILQSFLCLGLLQFPNPVVSLSAFVIIY